MKCAKDEVLNFERCQAVGNLKTRVRVAVGTVVGESKNMSKQPKRY